MRGKELEQSFIRNRDKNQTELIFFVNAGDPNLEVTFDILKVLAKHKVATVELCIPFPNSLTDGPLIKASHLRALVNGIDLYSVLELVRRARNELELSVVVLADFTHTVEPIGITNFLRLCSVAGASGTLIHCLPALQRNYYVAESAKLGLGRIMSFFAGSDQGIRDLAYQDAEGFIYVVSRFGKTGNKVLFDDNKLDQLKALRGETNKPLAIGFGVKTASDISMLRKTGADAVIIGSAATAVVENNLHEPDQIAPSFNRLVEELSTACC
jgi:tryptophan synthase alpha chain